MRDDTYDYLRPTDPPEQYARCGQCGERIVLVEGRVTAYGCPCFDGPPA